MGQRIVFPSLTDSQHAYTLYENLCDATFDFHRTAGLAPWAGMFATYGHDLVQHSPEWAAPKDNFADYLGSLAAYILDPANGGAGAKALDVIASRWTRDVDGDRVRFLATLKYDANKTRYYHKRENKASTADSKRHDKRWVEVPSYAEEPNRVATVYSLGDYPDEANGSLIAAFGLYSQVWEIIYRLEGWGQRPTDFFKMGRDDQHEATTAYRVIDCLARSHWLRSQAESAHDCRLRNLEYKRQREAEAIEAQAHAYTGPAAETPEPLAATA